jgi:putative tryptophan/tyrosine transport system substrate-binding protein
MMPLREGPPMVRRESRLNRRAFVVGAAGLGLLAGCRRLPGPGQAATAVPRIGVLWSVGNAAEGLDSFQQGLREHGYTEGQNIVVEYRSSGGYLEQLSQSVTELLQLPVALIVAGSTPKVMALQQTGSTLPIVMVVASDPIATGFIASFARPAGNITGPTQMTPLLSRKRLQLLTQAAPGTSHVGVLWNPADASTANQWPETQAAAQTLGVSLESLPVRGLDDFDGAFAAATSNGIDALLTLSDPLVSNNPGPILELAANRHLPAIYHQRRFAAAGGLMVYGVSISGLYRRAAYYVDRILKGVKPADLPVEQPMTFDFVVNLKTAQALGITFPNEIMLQVTEVIQ